MKTMTIRYTRDFRSRREGDVRDMEAGEAGLLILRGFAEPHPAPAGGEAADDEAQNPGGSAPDNGENASEGGENKTEGGGAAAAGAPPTPAKESAKAA
jgi:hypothetical protein